MYVTEVEIEKYMGVDIDSGLTSFIQTLIGAATKYVERYTSRVFENADTDSTRYYDGNGGTSMAIDDIRSITTMTVDGVDLTEESDFYTYPLNATADGYPIEVIQLIQPETRLASNANSRIESDAPYIFDVGQRTISITGKWGYSVTPPDDIKTVVMKLVGGLIRENIGDNDLKEVTSETIGDYSTSFAKIKDVAHSLGVSAVLDPYVREDAPRNSRKRVVSGFIEV